MKKIKNILSLSVDALESIDIFRFSLGFRLGKKEKSSTSSGKMMTISILIFLFYNFITSDLLKKKNAQTLSQDLEQSSHPDLLFSRKNFTLAIGMANWNNVFTIDESIFSIHFYQYHANNNDQTVNQTEIFLEPCTKSHFIENPDDFDLLSLNNTFCLPNENVRIRGYWDEEIIDYFLFQVFPCSNSSDSNIICKSNEEISYFFQNSYIEYYITNHNIDSENYNAPISRNLKMNYYYLMKGLKKEVDLFLKETQVITDDGFFLESINTISAYLQDQITCDVNLQNADSGDFIFEMDFYSSSIQTQVKRNYQKIQTLLAQLGGICNFLFFLGVMISKIENHYKVVSILSNELYIFPATYDKVRKDQSERVKSQMEEALESARKIENKGNSKTMKKSKYAQSSPNKQIVPILFLDKKRQIELNENYKSNSEPIKTQFQETIKNEDSKLDLVNKSKNLSINLEHYRKIKQKENNFSIGFCQFLKSFKKNRDTMTMQEKLFMEAQNHISEELDIVKLLNRLQEIDKLKRIVLSDEQIYFFDLLSKPMIVLDKPIGREVKVDDRRFKFASRNRFWFNDHRVEKLYKDMKIKSQKCEIDERIIKLLDEDVKCFLDNEHV